MKNKSTSAGRRTLWGREWTVYGKPRKLPLCGRCADHAGLLGG